jgi:transposase-like protein
MEENKLTDSQDLSVQPLENEKTDIPSKTCSKCNQLKSLEEFHKCKKFKDGHSYKCKVCYQQYYQEHREELKEYNKQYRLNKGV